MIPSLGHPVWGQDGQVLGAAGVMHHFATVPLAAGDEVSRAYPQRKGTILTGNMMTNHRILKPSFGQTLLHPLKQCGCLLCHNLSYTLLPVVFSSSWVMEHPHLKLLNYPSVSGSTTNHHFSRHISALTRPLKEPLAADRSRITSANMEDDLSALTLEK